VICILISNLSWLGETDGSLRCYITGHLVTAGRYGGRNEPVRQNSQCHTVRLPRFPPLAQSSDNQNPSPASSLRHPSTTNGFFTADLYQNSYIQPTLIMAEKKETEEVGKCCVIPVTSRSWKPWWDVSTPLS
jgi:hypothetical protein